MASELIPMPMHYTARMTDLAENAGLPSSERAQNQPMVDVPGRAPYDTLLNPVTARARHNPFTSAVLPEHDKLQLFEPSIFSPQQALMLRLTGAFQSTGNYQTPPLIRSKDTTLDAPGWNEMLTTEGQSRRETKWLEGKPALSTQLKNKGRDWIDPEFVYIQGMSVNRPSLSDFKQSANITINPGSDGSYDPGQACECKTTQSFGIGNVQSYALSSANFLRLYEMMRDAQLLGPIEKLVVFAGRTVPCMCSYITPMYANMYVGFTNGNNTAIKYEIDPERTLNTLNMAFIQRVMGNYQNAQVKAAQRQYRQFMGAAVRNTPAPIDASIIGRRLSSEYYDAYAKSLRQTDAGHIYGGALLSNPSTAAAFVQMSKPRIDSWNADAYVLTGLDVRHHRAMVESGAVTLGPQGTVNPEMVNKVLAGEWRPRE